MPLMALGIALEALGWAGLGFTTTAVVIKLLAGP